MKRISRIGARPFFLWSSLLSLILFLSIFPVNAQAGLTVAVGQNQTGEINATASSLSYQLDIIEPQIIMIQVLALSQNFAPAFSVYDPNGVLLQSISNTSQTNAQVSQAFISAGSYRIVVSSGNGQAGQFVLSLQAGGSLEPPQPIAAGDSLAGGVSAQAPILMYSFSADAADILRLTIHSDKPDSGPRVLLQDALSGETLAMGSARLVGVEFRIPASNVAVSYRVQVSYGGSSVQESFVLCLESENGSSNCPLGEASAPALPSPTAPATLVPLPSTGACIVAPAGGTAVNVRGGPSTNASVVAQLVTNTTANVLARLADGSWYQVNVNGITGWIAGSVVRVGGQCNAVPNITVTPAVNGSTTAPTPTATLAATSAATATTASTLNFGLPALFGSNALTSGFNPDPFSISFNGGGSVNVSYLGTGCAGYASSAPSFSLNYTSGNFPFLRFYYIGNTDATMVINTPSGNYTCIDDSFGTVDPTLDFNNPSSGRYDVWIASFQQGQTVSGTLYITELEANHP